MENGDSSEKKESIPATAETTEDVKSNNPNDVQGESVSETQLLSSNDLHKKEQTVPNKLDSLNIDPQGVPSGMQSSNNKNLQEEVPSGMQSSNTADLQIEDRGELSKELHSLNIAPQNEHQGEAPSGMQSPNSNNILVEAQEELPREVPSLSTNEVSQNQHQDEVGEGLNEQTSDLKELEIESPQEKSRSLEEVSMREQTSDLKELEIESPHEKSRSLEEIINEEKEVEPVFDGTESPGAETGSSSARSSDLEAQSNAWPDKAVALKNFVREKSVVAVSSVIRRLSGKKDEDDQNSESEEKNVNSPNTSNDEQVLPKETSPKPIEQSTWNPLSFIKIGRDADTENNVDIENIVEPLPLKGRIMLYTRLGCQESREVRLFLHQRRLRYVELNIDVYPSRKLELEKYAVSSAVPKVFFNDHVIGGLSELKQMDESGKLKEKINDLITEEPSLKAPVPPLSGEDDESCSGMVDELALIVRKMRESILVKDRFHRMRRFTNSFVGSEAVDFLSEDQCLERKEAIEFGRKLASKYFFRHVLEENVFEDGNHLYRLLDHDPIVSTQCYNIPRGLIDAKPKPIIDIASRLRFLSLVMFEAYTSIDGKHIDYRSIHGSEEFARYLRVVEELQRVEMQEMSREEKLAFFLNLYNMMAIHGILMWGYPVGALERRKMFGDFKYVIGGYTYSLSAIENGILRCNQRPPYNIMKPFSAQDPRTKIALPYPEPLIHFALVNGTRSAPALRCYSPSNIDKELMEAARNFLRNGGIVVDLETKVASVSKILGWYSADFGKNEMEVVKHATNYLETDKSEELLELLANTQLKVVYQAYDWGVNC